MIISASRRTDLPNYYSEWFFRRIEEGFLYVRNPFNPHQISKILLSPELVDCIVFWTKNPENMLSGLWKLEQYHYYFQFTLTGYGSKIEPYIPHKRDHMISVFSELSGKVSKERVIWRYDPILLTNTYTISYHLKAFEEIAGKLQGAVEKVVISFVDLYAKTKRNMRDLGVSAPTAEECFLLAREMAAIAARHKMKIESCAEQIDLSNCGISHGSCIDQKLIERITGKMLVKKKDKNQRQECGCMQSVEIGTYHTCQNGCLYCYANDSAARVRDTIACYSADSPLLCGELGERDVITIRKEG